MILEKVAITQILAACGMSYNADRATGVKAICEAMEQYGVTDHRHQAYILATVRNESAFLCIPEIRSKEGTDNWKRQEKYWHTGFYGRGYSQLTWKGNYEKFSKLLNLPLVEKPDLLLIPEYGAAVLVLGMRDGLFTGRSLKYYISGKTANYMGARAIVNGTFPGDKAPAKIAAWAEKVAAILKV